MELNHDQYLELEKIGVGAFSPLAGFMGEEDFHSCLKTGRLKSGAIFPVPIILDMSADEMAAARSRESIALTYQHQVVGRFFPESFYRPNREDASQALFGTSDKRHPGVAHFAGLKEFFAGGRVELLERVAWRFSEFEKTPVETKLFFQNSSWKTVVGFQTRNAPHRAHEYLLKSALEHFDGLMIQPLIGKKKDGDFTPSAVLAGYKTLLKNYFPAGRTLLTVLSTSMRYAGPREAVFHAIVRRNYGCTHFIIGRDHAGVGGYYKKYAAHDYAKTFDEKELGISILAMCGPYLCLKCDGIVTEKTCPHERDNCTVPVSGTWVREMLSSGNEVDLRIMRKEVVDVLRHQESLIGDASSLGDFLLQC